MNYSTLHFAVDRGVATVAIDNGELNLSDAAFIAEMAGVVKYCTDNDEVRVVVIKSVNPHFFVAHADLNDINDIPIDVTDDLFEFTEMMRQLRVMLKPTIAVVEGRARGGGLELALACDMRFGAIGSCIMGFPEVGNGIIPGSGGTVHLIQLVGYARAIEIILGGGDFDALQAERYGMINRAMPKDELWAYVNRLSRRLAHFPAESVRAGKLALLGSQADYLASLVRERSFFEPLLTAERRAAMVASLQFGVQTLAVETMCFDDLYDMQQGGV
jgi:enoyl-CoA hydratase/carnithine racemase